MFRIQENAHLISNEIYIRIRPFVIGFWLFEAVTLFALNNLAIQLVVKDQSIGDSLINYFQYFFQGTYWMLFALFVLNRSFLIHDPNQPLKLSWFLKHMVSSLIVVFGGFVVEYFYLVIFFAKAKGLMNLAQELSTIYLFQMGTFVLKYFFIISIAQTVAYFSNMKNKETEKYKIEVEFSELKYQFLVSQIKPHFIFNAHHAIISLIEQGDVTRSSDMLVKLSSLLRNVLNFSNRKFISLKEEISNLDNYIQIQLVRFGSTIDYTIQCDQDLQSFQVPPLVLQPLVENCFNYAFTNKQEGKIVVKCYTLNSNVYLEVKDNGQGFQRKQSNTGHGIDNIGKRIELAYGSKANLEINSSPATGTNIKITIPKYETPN